MPPTGRRRKAKEAEQRADADATEITTPSRKRRRVGALCIDVASAHTNMTQVNGSNANTTVRAARQASHESDATIENQEEEDDIETQLREAEAIIPRLRVALYQVGVSIEHNNAIVPANDQAFAKIAGRDWTYYVKTTNVIIGRPNAKAKRESAEGASTPVAAGGGSELMVNIDLGPDQQISRTHAEIVYESGPQVWAIHCNGRNGLHIDEQRVERGQVAVLHSGAVLSILGTQFIFLLPNETPVINEHIRRQLLEEGDAYDEKHEPGDGKPKGTNVRLGGKSQSSGQAGSFPQAGGSGTQAAHALAQLSSSQQPPGTPRLQPPLPKSKNSPAYTVKGVMIESTDDIDYSADASKDIKPPHSYAQMIGQAILSREGENATLAQIYEFIKDHYAFFRHGGGGWQNSIRHNLSLSKHFEKIPRRTDEPGKGMKWQIVPEFREEYMKKNFHENRRPTGRRLDSSGPNSPAMGMGQGSHERLMGAMNDGPAYIKRHSGSPTPPRHAFPAPNESFTPERGGRGMRLSTGQPAFTNGGAPMSAASELVTPTFERNNPLASQQTYSAQSNEGMNELNADSPPTLLGAGHETVGHGMHTPLPARSAPKPFPSTIKPPSFYTQQLFSSPAPFWKFADLGHSTPLKPLMPDLSPEKYMKPKPEDDEKKLDLGAEADEEEDDEIQDDYETEKKEEDSDEIDAKPNITSEANVDADVNDEAPPADTAEVSVIPPSSPPGKKASTPEEDDNDAAPDESPTRTVSRPVSRREPIAAPTNGLVSGPTPIPQLKPQVPQQPRFNIHTTSFMRGYNQMNGADDEDEDEGIDLSK